MVMQAIAERIRRNGPITFAEFHELALYDPDDGFFTSGGGAGRAGRDFVTSPEVGPLFGALVARHLDAAWARLGRPDPFVVVDAGAARGRCAADVLRSAPACAPALRYVLVERSPALRVAQRDLLTLEPADEVLGPVLQGEDEDEAPQPVAGMGPIVTSLEDLPAVPFAGVVFANELLDNLPVRIVERGASGWFEVRVALDGSEARDATGALCEVVVPAEEELVAEADAACAATRVPVGARLPIAEGSGEWLVRVARVLRAGEVVLVDYFASVEELVARGQDGWLRTYRGHARGSSPLADPGTQDITCDVPIEQLRSIAARLGLEITIDTSQAAWLDGLGLGALVEEGREIWRRRAGVGDLDAIAGQSRVREAQALTDVEGLGAHRVVILTRAVG
jgi:SAM-dependent MidA family methyltransferase